MSNTNTGETDQTIDAEIIGEASSSARNHQKTNVKSSKVIWVLLAIITVFVVSIFSIPYAEHGLKRLGWLSEEPAAKAPAMRALIENQQQQAKELNRLQLSLNKQAVKIEQLLERNSVLNKIQEVSDAKHNNKNSYVTAKLTELSTEVNTLKTQQLETGGAADPLTLDLLKKLEGDLALEQTKNTVLSERIAILEESVLAASKNAASETASVRMLVAANNIYRKLTAGESYTVELAAIEADFNSLSALQVAGMGNSLIVLRDNKTGVESIDALSKQFQNLIPIITATNLTAEESGENTPSWWEQLFTIRRTDGTATGADAIIRTIELALSRGDLDTVSTSIEAAGLQNNEGLSAWHAALKKRHDALVASETLFVTLTTPAGVTTP